MHNRKKFVRTRKYFVGMECFIIAAVIGVQARHYGWGIAAFGVLLCMFYIPILRGILSIFCSIFAAAAAYCIVRQFLPVPATVLVTFGTFYLFIIIHRALEFPHSPHCRSGQHVLCRKENLGVRKYNRKIKADPKKTEDKEKSYYRQTYYQITHNNYYDMLSDNGKYGEYMIYEKLKNYESLKGRFLFNCYLGRGENKTTEIDVLLICSSGIFVFESKNYNGWIVGKEEEKNWTQCLAAGKGKLVKIQFYNPIKQNQAHMKHLKNYIGSNIPMFSIVVFSDKCTLKDIKVKRKNECVIQLKQLAATVDWYMGETGTVLSEKEIAALYYKLYPLTQVSQEVKEKHIRDIEDYKALSNMDERENKSVQVLVCPRCGSPMVLRTVKQGQDIGNVFYGCSAFPICKYTKKATSLENRSFDIF